MKEKSNYFLIFTILILIIFIVLATWRAHWYYYKRPLRQIEINLASKVGEKNSINFTLPKGGYIIKAEIQGDLIEDDEGRKIRYGVSLPAESISIDQEVMLDFSLKVRQVHLRQFRVKQKESNGVFFVEPLTLTIPNIKIKVYIVEIVYFRTVE